MFHKSLILCFLFAATMSSAQDAPSPLTPEERSEVIDSIGAILNRDYVFPEVGEQIQAHLQGKARDGAFDAVTDPFEFARILTEEVRAINDDRHLRVGFNPDMIAERRDAVTPEDSMAIVERQRRNGQMNNYGFREVKVMDGNIGYLNLTGFYHVNEESGHAAQSAMNFLSNCDALIIDLRTNGGGSPSMIQLISSYLFDSESVHLNSFYYRPQDEITQTWTLPYVPGKRRPDMDVYVLTSSSTFSAAEEFSYNLRNLERATLVGETTGGGAHPGGTRIATERFTVWVPTGRAINPVTNTNWEGTGVKPHIETPADKALDVAQITAIEKLLAKSDEAQMQARYQWALDGLKAAHSPATVETSLLMSYAGKYGPRTITYHGGQLFYQREGNAKYALIPMSDDTFMIEEIPYFRIRILKESGKVTGLMGMYESGRTDRNLRDTSKS